LEVGLDALAPTDVLDDLNRAGREPTVVAVVDCPATNLRRSVAMTHQGSGRWTGTLEMSRNQASGPVLVRAVLAARVGSGHRRELGESQLWTIHIDPPAIPVIEGTLPVQWADFPSAENIPESAKGDAFFADLSEDAPVIYLNSAFDGLPELLSDDGNRPAGELALREAEYRRIGTSVWLGMFNVAAAAIELNVGGDDDGESAEPELPASEWQRSVLQTLIPRMFDESESEALRKIATARTGDESREVQTHAAAAIGRLVDKAAGSLKKRIQQLSGAAG